ncbi:MAG: hypothetical protein R3E32_13430 [Chitinophagales bacterium]
MKVEAKKIEQLLTKVTQQTGKSLNHADFKELTEEINAAIDEGRLKGVMIGERYIYDNMYRPLNKMEENEFLALSKNYLDTIARHAGYQDFRTFENLAVPKSESHDEILQRCGGTWKSYVRTNSGRSELLAAPLHIFQENGNTVIEMKGEHNIVYRSELTLRGGCLRCLLDGREKDDRQIYMVMRLASASKPKVLLGIFAGMSNGGAPIGGREVWIREEEGKRFEDLSHQVLDMEENEEEIHKNILRYFDKKEKNCWKSTLPSSFDVRDLKNE